ncbi:hypothetical protein DUZ99_17310 [Xylanibacillus composti]|uniref:Beta-hydroxyacyl-ACP dehydratase n=1 Tax=Xylanibacillus composti TaxID=1572762 RepID=A0A8J4M1Z0_9BACL|nr:hypothetical protein [Xylanibacillus composti]MDT9726738.1 hypothetical protein [Xylanibacillus composti]GIQ69330.1 beta-hydroxyacyl-ACP dehydratase [Xylanibacillus composti]
MRAERILPYAKPWILIDQVTELKGGTQAVAVKQISSSDFYLQGHFPAHSIYPGMLLLEGIRQTIACVFLQEGTAAVWKESEVSSRFMHPVEPGDSVKYVVIRRPSGMHAAQFDGEGWVGDNKVIQARIAYRKEEEANEANARQ